MLFANSTQIMINAANVLGNKEDVKYYTSLLFKIKMHSAGNMSLPSEPHDVEYSDCVCASVCNLICSYRSKKEYAAKLLVDNIKSYNNPYHHRVLGTPISVMYCPIMDIPI